MSRLKTVVKVFWQETERGWGTRPDGYSYHLNMSDYDAYMKEYWARMPKEVPDEYSRPTGHELIDVTPARFQKIANSTFGVRVFSDQDWDVKLVDPQYELHGNGD